MSERYGIDGDGLLFLQTPAARAAAQRAACAGALGQRPHGSGAIQKDKLWSMGASGSTSSASQTLAILVLGSALLYVAWKHNCLSKELQGMRTLMEASVSLHDLEEHVMPAIDGLEREAAQLRREMRQVARATAVASRGAPPAPHPTGGEGAIPPPLSSSLAPGADYADEEDDEDEEGEDPGEAEEGEEEDGETASCSSEGGSDDDGELLARAALHASGGARTQMWREGGSAKASSGGGHAFGSAMPDLSLLMGMTSLLASPPAGAFPLQSGGAVGGGIPVTRVVISSSQPLGTRLGEEREREGRIEELVDQSG